MRLLLAVAVALAVAAVAGGAGGATTAPVVSGVTVSAVGPVSAALTWQTSTPARSWVELGTSTAFGVWVPGSTTPARRHTATLTGLAPTTSYAFRIVALDARGGRGTASGTLTTAAIPAHTTASTLGNTILLDGRPFFPIMAWSQCHDTLDQALAAGIDVFVGGCMYETPAETLAAIAGRGYAVLPVGDHGLADGPGLIGWNYKDESDGFQVLPDQMPVVPPAAATGQLTFLTLSVHFWSGADPLPIGKSYYPQYFAKPDVLGFDVYPIQKFCGNRWTTVATVFDAQHELIRADGVTKPTYQWIEAAVMDSECTYLTETARDLRAEVWLAVAGGANGIGYFTHSFIGDFWNRFDVSPELRAEITAENDELRALAPALLGRRLDVAVAAGSPVRAGARLSNGALYTIAVNPDTSPARATLTVPGLASRRVSVLGEDRTLQARNGTLTDSFGPREARIYVAAPAWTLPASPPPARPNARRAPM